MGSGTTLRAALRFRRHAIGIDTDEHYCEIAAKRLENDAGLFVDTHNLGTCLRFANGETCIGCGDAENGAQISTS
jgi:hypothetical protein